MEEGRTWKKPEVIVAIMSSIIAICAIVIAYNEGQATRKHNRLSLRPLLVVTQTESTIKLQNYTWKIVAFGPAMIDKDKICVPRQERSNLRRKIGKLSLISLD